MILAFTVLRSTPWWVYALFGLLTYLGLIATRMRTVILWRLFLAPAVFVAWGIATLVLKSHYSPTLLAEWLLTAVGGSVMAIMITRFDMQIDHDRKSIIISGSLAPLVRSLLIFAAKYGISVATALHMGSRDVLALFDLGISGASAGYFIGWLARFYLAYRILAGAGRIKASQNTIASKEVTL